MTNASLQRICQSCCKKANGYDNAAVRRPNFRVAGHSRGLLLRFEEVLGYKERW